MPLKSGNSEAALALKEQGNVEFKKHNFTEARNFYTSAIEIDPAEPSLYTNRASCNLQLSNFQEALRDCNRALETSPNFAKAFFRAGQALLGLGRIEEAEMRFRRGYEISKDKSFVPEIEKTGKIKSLVAIASQQEQKKKLAEALKTYEDLLKLCPQAIPFKVKKAELLLETKQYKEASSIAVDILQNDDPSNAEAMFIKGRCYYYEGNPAQATAMLRNALSMDPDNVKIQQFRRHIQKLEQAKEEANKLFREGSLDAAYQKYTEALELDPLNNAFNSQLYNNRATVAFKMKKYELALDDSTKAIELNPGYSKAYSKRAQCYCELEKYEEALHDLNRVSELEPGENQELNRQIKQVHQLAKKLRKKDYYKILGISKNATDDEIRTAYRKQSSLNHPDRFVDEKEKKAANERFQDIGEANAILSDPNKRRMYDSGADAQEINSGMGGMGGMNFGSQFGAFDMSDILMQMMGGRGSSRGGSGGSPFGQTFSFSFGGNDDSNPFSAYSSGSSASAKKKKKGQGFY
jgi:DnaJ family protein C protein 7